MSTRRFPRGRSGLATALTTALAGALLGLPAAPAAAAPACAPSLSTVGSDTVLTFTNSVLCTWTVPAGVTTADVLVVGGGGGGWSDDDLGYYISSGGGAGGVIHATGAGNTGYTFGGATVDVVAGTGGAGHGWMSGTAGSGTNSSFGALVAVGGGGAGESNGVPGGSGGGGGAEYGSPTTGGAGTAGQGNAGGPSTGGMGVPGGGGGGAGGAGLGAGVPGAGVSISITGSAVTYAAGGAGTHAYSYAGMSPSATYPNVGGGGRSDPNAASGDNGSDGTVVVRYSPPAAPGTPGTPTAVAGDGEATVTVTTPSTGGAPDTYDVTTVEDNSLTCTVTSPATSCTVTGLTNGNSYTFTSTATNTIGTSSASAASAPVVPALSSPGTPGTPTGSPGDATVTVTVTAPSTGGAPASYTVREATDHTLTCTVTSPATSCAINGLINGTPYTFESRATNTAGSSGWSAASAPVTPLLAVPGTPGRPTAAAGDGDANVSIDPPHSGGTVVSYTVRVTGDPAHACTVTSPATFCTVAGLTNGLAYTFESRATNSAGSSAFSLPSQAVTPRTDQMPLSRPSPATAVAGPASVIASWPRVTDATGYRVTADPGPATCVTTSTTCVLGATAGRTYTVTVIATTDSVTSIASEPSNPVTPTSPEVPATPPESAPPTLTTDRGPIGVVRHKAGVVLEGSGFAKHSTVELTAFSEPLHLATVTADGSGAFSAHVTLPEDLEPGTHTLLATGVAPDGDDRSIARPLVVTPAGTGSEGPGGTRQTVRLPVPDGGSIRLLDGDGRAVTKVDVPEGTYTVDETGVIAFSPVAGFTGTATAVTYRVIDAIGTEVTGTHTAVVSGGGAPLPPAGTPSLALPARLVSTTGSRPAVTVPCRLSRGALDGCAVTATVQVDGHRRSVGRATVRPAATSTVRQVPVGIKLDALGRTLAARPGGVKVTFEAEVSQRGRPGTVTARRSTRVVAGSFQLPRTIRFASGKAVVRAADASYLRSVRAELDGARTITCVGHSDNRGSASAAVKLGRQRARSACAVLAKGLKVTVHTASRGASEPVATNRTADGRASNRRAVITVHYR